jgi:hypothetical protein
LTAKTIYQYFGFSIGFADIVTALDEATIGSKVLDSGLFMNSIADAMDTFDWSTCHEPGQAYIVLNKKACAFVSGGVGKRTQNPDDYVIRTHRGDVGIYLKRYRGEMCIDITGKEYYDTEAVPLAAPVDNVAVIVYTLDAYLRDPDCTIKESERIKELGCTHILVAVLASSGKPSTLTPHRFLANLAGGNNEALHWTADEIRQKAKDILEFTSEWSVVAD